MTKKKYKQKRAKKKKNRGRGKGKCGGCVKPAAMMKIFDNHQYLLERVLSYLPWRVKRGKSHFKPSYFGVSHFMSSYTMLAGASNNTAFSWWFETCCDAGGMFVFNPTPWAGEIFRRSIWKNYYNSRYCDEIVQACRAVCFKSKRTRHQQVKSLTRSYAMLMLFSSDILTSPKNPVLAGYAHHLVGQWMVKHVKDWETEVHRVGFFKQLREACLHWTKAEKLGCPSSFQAKLTLFDWYSKPVLLDYSVKNLKYKHFI